MKSKQGRFETFIQRGQKNLKKYYQNLDEVNLCIINSVTLG
jgi:hypothetical protein